MIRNEHAYELSATQIAAFDLNAIAEIAAMRTGDFTYIDAGHAYLTVLKAKFPSLMGISIYSLPNRDAIDHTYDDENQLDLPKSRLSALDFVVGAGSVGYEWWTGNGAQPGWQTGSYRNQNFPLTGNTKLFELAMTVPTLVKVTEPYVRFAEPAGTVMVSVGFKDTFETVMTQLQNL